MCAFDIQLKQALAELAASAQPFDMLQVRDKVRALGGADAYFTAVKHETLTMMEQRSVPKLLEYALMTKRGDDGVSHWIFVPVADAVDHYEREDGAQALINRQIATEQAFDAGAAEVTESGRAEAQVQIEELRKVFSGATLDEEGSHMTLNQFLSQFDPDVVSEAQTEVDIARQAAAARQDVAAEGKRGGLRKWIGKFLGRE